MADTRALWLALRSLFTTRPPTRRGGDARLGAKGERIAARMLRRTGYKVIARNVRGKAGEIDIVCLAPDRRTVVFVEVKTRRLAEGAVDPLPPEVNVTYDKQQKLIRLAREFARRKGYEDRPLRIDVVAVQVPRRGKPVVRHLEDAVRRR